MAHLSCIFNSGLEGWSLLYQADNNAPKGIPKCPPSCSSVTIPACPSLRLPLSLPVTSALFTCTVTLVDDQRYGFVYWNSETPVLNRRQLHFVLQTPFLKFSNSVTQWKCMPRLCYEHDVWLRYGNSRAIWDHSVTCHPAEVTFPPLSQPIKAGTRFSDPRGWILMCWGIEGGSSWSEVESVVVRLLFVVKPVYRRLRMTENTQFPGFLFPQVVEKH